MLPYRVLKMIRNRMHSLYYNDGRSEINYIRMFDCWIVIIIHTYYIKHIILI